jgi:hypothetical protein
MVVTMLAIMETQTAVAVAVLHLLMVLWKLEALAVLALLLFGTYWGLHDNCFL